MGLGTLTDRAAGQTILDTFFNDIHSAINGDFVGRNTSGAATAGQNLGTAAIPWGVVRASSLVLAGTAVDTSQIVSPANRVVSGKTRSTSNQPAFVVPNGAALSLQVTGSATNLVLAINGVAVTVSTDISKTGLTAAPSSNNTALVNDTDAADQEETKLWGEVDGPRSITIDTVGTEITALIGKWAAFRLDNGSTTEDFIGYVESATKISKCYRGFFYNSTIAPQKRIVFSNNDTITLLKLGWIFVENDGITADVTYTNPAIDFVSPSSPTTGDYWYDLANNQWKRYDGATFQIINRTLVGMFANTTTACVGARSLDFHANYSADNTLDIVKETTEIARAAHAHGTVSVKGIRLYFGIYLPNWNITTDLAPAADMYNASEQASTEYFLYMKDTGETVISDISPYTRADLFGKYHPHNPWRCIGVAYNNSGSNLTRVSGGGDGGWKKFDMYITAATTNPTKGTVAVDHAEWRRNGKFCHVRWLFKKTSGTGTAGSGNYWFSLPHKAEEIYTETAFRDASPAYATPIFVPGQAWLSTTGDMTSSFRPLMVLINDDALKFLLVQTNTPTSATASIVSDAFGDLNAISHMQVDFSYPVEGWGDN